MMEAASTIITPFQSSCRLMMGLIIYFVVVVRRLGVDVLGAFIHNYTLSIPFMLLIIYLHYNASKVPLIYYSFM